MRLQNKQGLKNVIKYSKVTKYFKLHDVTKLIISITIIQFLRELTSFSF